MLHGKTYHRFRALLDLWVLEALIPVSLMFVATQIAYSLIRKGVHFNRLFSRFRKTPSKKTYTVVMTGGKMSKTLHLVRCLKSMALGDPNVEMKIIVLESKRFRYSASRFSRCVDHFQVITSPRDSCDAYMQDIFECCRNFDATHFLPVAAPVEAVFDAKLKRRLEQDLGVKVLHMDYSLCSILDNKHAFGQFLRDNTKARTLRTHRVTSDEQVRKFNTQLKNEKQDGLLERNLILKNLQYDPIHRLDLFQLPTTNTKLDQYLQRISNNGNPITEEEPWQLQEFLANGTEYAAMIVVRSNRLVTMTCCPSSASQLNYVHTEIPSIRTWVEDFLQGLGCSEHVLTGQLCFDFMVVQEGTEQVAYPIECNPRVHTQCSIYNRDDVRVTLGALLLEDTIPQKEELMVKLLHRDYGTSECGKKLNVYWFYNEWFKIFPNSWLFFYNSDRDANERAKLAMSDLPLTLKSVWAVGVLYLPALLISFLLTLPVWPLLLIFRQANAAVKPTSCSNLTLREDTAAIIFKLVQFFHRLADLHFNIEGDTWDSDLIPFLAKNHVQVPSRLLATVRTGVEWKKVDFAIGKVVEVGGD
eukprot:scaffold4420_cov187-Amphora_coffeaeformis.AAC.10